MARLLITIHPPPDSTNPLAVPPLQADALILGADRGSFHANREARVYQYTFIDGSNASVFGGFKPTPWKLSGEFVPGREFIRVGANRVDRTLVEFQKLEQLVGQRVSVVFEDDDQRLTDYGVFRFVKIDSEDWYMMQGLPRRTRWTVNMLQEFGTAASEQALGTAQLVVKVPSDLTKIGDSDFERLANWDDDDEISLGLTVTEGVIVYPLSVEVITQGSLPDGSRIVFDKRTLDGPLDTIKMETFGMPPTGSYLVNLTLHRERVRSNLGRQLRVHYRA